MSAKKTTVKPAVKEWPPKTIYLTTGDDEAKVYGEKDELTWCQHQITVNDVEYVRVSKRKKK